MLTLICGHQRMIFGNWLRCVHVEKELPLQALGLFFSAQLLVQFRTYAGRGLLNVRKQIKEKAIGWLLEF